MNDSADFSDMAFHDPIDKLAHTSALSDDENARILSQQKIRELATQMGIFTASHHALYMAFGQGEIQSFTVPAINVRTLTYDFCRRAFKLAMRHNIGVMIFELAASEQKYTNQTPSEYSASVLAAAIKEGYKGPVFIQGDHYQASADIEQLKKLISTSIEAQFFNIDIDGSTLVDLEKLSVPEQQEKNIEITADLTEFIRRIQPSGVTISIGAEIGHIGGVNSTVEDFNVFMEGYQRLIHPKNLVGISKIAVQTGTSHGGIPRADGTIEKVAIDFKILKEIAKIARETYHIGGAVQHGASTLPDELYHQFPENNTLEIHLSTGFQNIIFEHMGASLKEKIYAWTREHTQDELKKGLTDAQFIYKARKKAWGAFKKEMWLMPQAEKDKILDALEVKLAFLFTQLRVENTRDQILKYY